MSNLTRRDLLRIGAAGTLGLWLSPDLLARAADAGPRLVDHKALEDLRRRLHGRLLLPTDKGYTEASQPANTRFEHTRPLAVAECANEADVITAVKWSRENGVAPTARTGGHSYAGFSTTTGLLIDLARLNTIAVDPQRGTARIGGGAVNRDLLNATRDRSLILPGGTCLAVGISGLTLGGGVGYNTHWAGLTSDHLRASRLVTASGELVEIDDARHADLLWACRGGAGGSFGINTSLSFELVPVPRKDVAFFRFDYRGADAAAAVLAAFDKMLQTAPAALNAVAMAEALPVSAGGPREAIHTFARGQYIGPLSELRELVAPLLAAATPSDPTTLKTLPFWEMQGMFASEETKRHSFGDISRYSQAPLPDAVVGQVVDLLAACPSRDANNNGSMWSLGWVGGSVVNSIGRRETAYVHRNMLTMLRATPVWETNAPATVRDGLIAWTRQMISLIAPYTPNESYQNFPNRGITDWQRQYYAENFDRLVEVKTKYDPHDVFRNLQSIPRR